MQSFLCVLGVAFTLVAHSVQPVRLQAAHCKLVINRDVRPNNLMHTQSQVCFVDWGSATLQKNAPYESMIHYASIGVLQQLTRKMDSMEVGPADDFESLVASMFCISHPDAHNQLQKVEKLPIPVMQWCTQTWTPQSQWQLALRAARAANHDSVGDCLLALLEENSMLRVCLGSVVLPGGWASHYSNNNLGCWQAGVHHTSALLHTHLTLGVMSRSYIRSYTP